MLEFEASLIHGQGNISSKGNSKVLQTCQAFSSNIVAWLQSHVKYFQRAIFQRAICLTFVFETFSIT